METYVPIIRPGKNELTVLNQFNSEEGEEVGSSITPLLEITGEGKIDDIEEYRDGFDRVLIDFPTYLLEKKNKFTEKDSSDKNIEDLAETYTSDEYTKTVEFFRDNMELINIPVLSKKSELNYMGLKEDLQEIYNEFDRIGVRIVLPPAKLDKDEVDDLKELEEEIEDNDIVLFDILKIEDVVTQVYENLKIAMDVFDGEYEKYLLNAFEPRNGGHNYNPVLSKSFDFEGFGDYVLEKRYPDYGGSYTETRVIRHYDPDSFEVKTFRDEGYESTFESLRRSDYWNPNHCFKCREIENMYVTEDIDFNEGHSFWKKVRMTHYIHSIVYDTFFAMKKFDKAEDLDMDGFDEITKRNGP